MDDPQAPVMDYLDFVLRFETREGEHFPITAASRAGEARAFFRPPFSAARARARLNAGEVAALRTMGDELFRALFTGKIHNLYERSLGHIEADPYRGLRIKIHLDPAHPDLRMLCAIPWELLFDTSRGQFLSHSRHRAVVRYLAVPRPVHDLTVPPPLRILLAAYPGLGPMELFLDRQQRLIRKTLAQTPGVTHHMLENVTRKALRRKVLEEKIHMVHFMGHGDFDEREGRGSLWFQAPNGGKEKVTGPALAELLSDAPHLKLVFLDACESGKNTAADLEEPFAGVAAALMLGGVPAVLAMQYPLYNETAASFSEHFYACLAAGDPLEAAMAEGRQAMALDYPHLPDWVCPVLYSRAPNGAFLAAGQAGTAAFSPKQDALHKLVCGIKGMAPGRVSQSRRSAGPHAAEPSGLGTPVEQEDTPSPIQARRASECHRWTHAVNTGHRVAFLGESLFLEASGSPQISFDLFAHTLWEQLPEVAARKPMESLKALELFAHFQGAAALTEQALAFFGKGRPLQGRPLKALAALPFSRFVTTWPGPDLARVLQSAGKNPLTVTHSSQQPPPPTADMPWILHLFGHVQDPDQLALTESLQVTALASFLAATKKTNKFWNPTDSWLLLGLDWDHWRTPFLLQTLGVGAGSARSLALGKSRPPNSARAYFHEIHKLEWSDLDMMAFLNELQRR